MLKLHKTNLIFLGFSIGILKKGFNSQFSFFIRVKQCSDPQGTL